MSYFSQSSTPRGESPSCRRRSIRPTYPEPSLDVVSRKKSETATPHPESPRELTRHVVAEKRFAYHADEEDEEHYQYR